jgi:O-antigen/teichoic acid export membrane protein
MLSKNIASNYVGQFLIVFINVAFVPLYLKYLGLEAYGLIGLFATIQVWFSIFDFGLNQAINKQFAEKTKNSKKYSLLKTTEIILLSVGAILTLLVYASSDWLSKNWIKSDQISPEQVKIAIVTMILIVAFKILEGTYKNAILGLQHQIIFNVFNVAINLFRSGGVVLVIVFIDQNINLFFLWQLAVTILGVFLLRLLAYRLGNKQREDSGEKFSIQRVMEVRGFAGAILVITLLSTILTQSDKAFLSAKLDLSDYAVYMLATLIANCVLLLSVPISQAFFPKLCEGISLRNKHEFIHYYHFGCQLTSVIVGSFSVVLIFFSKEIIFLWTHNSQLATEGYLLTSILAFGNLINSLLSMPYQAQLAYGWTKLALYTNVAAAIVLVPALYFIAPIYGGIGAAWIWVSLNLATLIFGMHFFYKKVIKNQKSTWYLDDVFYPLLAAFISGAALKILLAQWPINPIYQIILISLIGSFILVCSSFASKDIRAYIIKKLREYA